MRKYVIAAAAIAQAQPVSAEMAGSSLIQLGATARSASVRDEERVAVGKSLQRGEAAHSKGAVVGSVQSLRRI